MSSRFAAASGRCFNDAVTADYDRLNGPGPDYDYWLRTVARVAPRDICDLGCGTGALTVLFAGHADARPRVTGVDPDPGMLAVARARPGHELVTWIDGY